MLEYLFVGFAFFVITTVLLISFDKEVRDTLFDGDWLSTGIALAAVGAVTTLLWPIVILWSIASRARKYFKK